MPAAPPISSITPKKLVHGKRIAVIGGGWYGCHIASVLNKHGHDITLYEKEAALFKGVSGSYGIRIHIGPHYPRSPITRRDCLAGYHRFVAEYPELIIDHDFSYYGLGLEDVDGIKPRIGKAAFEQVCKECPGFGEVDLRGTDFQRIEALYSVIEPSLKMEIVGDHFQQLFDRKEIRTVLNHPIETIHNKTIDGIRYDHIINCTYFKALLPKQIPLDIEIVYQPCLTLFYQDRVANTKPFSFTVMDGWYPCIMPYENAWKSPNNRTYVLYHAKYTILGTFDTVAQAQNVLDNMTDNDVQGKRPLFEKDIHRYYPTFADRFVHVGYNTGIATKIKSQSEFRSAIVFADDDEVIHVFSGKVNNIFAAADRVVKLVSKTAENDDFSDIQQEISQTWLEKGIKAACDL
ncbi:hypothetical protein BC940DRAFT_308467 [Gongronella butleri]|nr:hypothetical protein BC940DRAFT_308467 [Gongronella butleri]